MDFEDEQEHICCTGCITHQKIHDERPPCVLFDMLNLPLHAKHPLVWMTILLVAMLAWIATIQQAQSMLSMPMSTVGPMGMSLVNFLLFWTIMMIAMMFPALAPTASVQLAMLRQQVSSIRACSSLLIFLVGYLLIWTVFGLPVFFLSLLNEYFVLHAPTWNMGLDIALLTAIGLYQIMPIEKRFLSHCNPTLGCCTEISSPPNTFFHLRTGLIHGIHCLGCCGGLMLVMVVVGLMNLPWMILLMMIIFLEKTWYYGDRLSFLVGIGFILFAMLAFIDPTLLSIY
jgi:predicted metal-binding membrane protein